MSLLIKWFVISFTLFFLPFFVEGILVDSFLAAFIAAFVLGLFSITIKPVLRLVTIPINLVTFGFFSFIINAVIFWSLTLVVKGMTVSGFLPALIGSLVVWLVVMVIDFFLDND